MTSDSPKPEIEVVEEPVNSPAIPDDRSLFQRLADWLFGYDFFISYTWSDGRKYALQLKERLEDSGFKCFLDSSDYAKGDNWREQGRRALKRTSRLVLVGTPNVLQSEPVENELRIYSALKRRIYQIDIDGNLDPEGRNEKIFEYLDPDGLRIHETAEAMETGPGTEVLEDIRRTFNLVRQDKKRVRWFAAAAAVFAALAIVATALGFVANRERKAANQAQTKAENVAAKSIARQLGTPAGDLPESEIDALWELAAIPEESERIRKLVLQHWLEDPGLYAGAAEDGFALKALGSDRFQDEETDRLRLKTARVLVSNITNPEQSQLIGVHAHVLWRLGRDLHPDRQAQFGKVVTGGMNETTGAFHLSALGLALAESTSSKNKTASTDAITQLRSGLSQTRDPEDRAFLVETLAQFKSCLSSEDIEFAANSILEVMADTSDGVRLSQMALALSRFDERVPPEKIAAGAEYVLSWMTPANEFHFQEMAEGLEALASQLAGEHIADFAEKTLYLMNESQESFLPATLGSVLGRIETLDARFTQRAGKRLMELMPGVVLDQELRSLGTAIMRLPEGRFPDAMDTARWLIVRFSKPAGVELSTLRRISEESPNIQIADQFFDAVEAQSATDGYDGIAFALASLANRVSLEDALAIAGLEAGLEAGLLAEVEDPLVIGAIGESLGRLNELLSDSNSKELTPIMKQAAATIARTVINLEDEYYLGSLWEGLWRLGKYLSEEDAANLADFIISRMNQPDLPIHNLGSFGYALAKCAKNAPKKSIAEASGILMQAMEDSGDSETRSRLGWALALLSSHLPESNATRAYATSAFLPAGISEAPVGFEEMEIDRKLFLDYCDSLSLKELSDVLKWPFCVGEAEQIVLSALERRLSDLTKDPVDLGGNVNRFRERAGKLGVEGIDSPPARPSFDAAMDELNAY